MNIQKTSEFSPNDFIKLPNYSQQGLVIDNLDSTQDENKKILLDNTFKKIRLNGQVVICFKDCTKILNLYPKILNTKDVVDIIGKVKFYTNPILIENIITEFSQEFDVIKIIEEDYDIYITLKRKQYPNEN